MARRQLAFTLGPRSIIGGLIAASFLLALLDNNPQVSALTPLRSLATDILSPLQSVSMDIARPIAKFGSDLTHVSTKDRVINSLQLENDKLKMSLRGQKDLVRRTNELDGLLHSAGVGRYRIVMARVTSIGAASNFGSTIEIDGGSADGIKPNMNVMSDAGLVGRVLSTTKFSSTVVLIIDGTSTVGARIASSGEIGFVTGTGKAHSMMMEFIDPRTKVAAGDQIVSYGASGGIFAPGLPIGIVTKVRTATGTNSRIADVQPYADFSSLDLVGIVVTKPRTDPRNALLPTETAKPTVTVTVTVNAGDGAVAVGSDSASANAGTP